VPPPILLLGPTLSKGRLRRCEAMREYGREPVVLTTSEFAERWKRHVQQVIARNDLLEGDALTTAVKHSRLRRVAQGESFFSFCLTAQRL
jgi:hypothetical protein